MNYLIAVYHGEDNGYEERLDEIVLEVDEQGMSQVERNRLGDSIADIIDAHAKTDT